MGVNLLFLHSTSGTILSKPRNHTVTHRHYYIRPDWRDLGLSKGMSCFLWNACFPMGDLQNSKKIIGTEIAVLQPPNSNLDWCHQFFVLLNGTFIHPGRLKNRLARYYNFQFFHQHQSPFLFPTNHLFPHYLSGLSAAVWPRMWVGRRPATSSSLSSRPRNLRKSCCSSRRSGAVQQAVHRPYFHYLK